MSRLEVMRETLRTARSRAATTAIAVRDELVEDDPWPPNYRLAIDLAEFVQLALRLAIDMEMVRVWVQQIEVEEKRLLGDRFGS